VRFTILNPKTSDLKTIKRVLGELNESYTDFASTMTDAIKEIKTTKKLWHSGQKPWLIQLGLALILFPEPVISDILGSLLIAAGTIQQGLRRRSLHVEDIPKTFENILRELQVLQENVQLQAH
jgi:hypothetical protein